MECFPFSKNVCNLFIFMFYEQTEEKQASDKYKNYTAKTKRQNTPSELESKARAKIKP